jgi:hypothetical protein
MRLFSNWHKHSGALQRYGSFEWIVYTYASLNIGNRRALQRQEVQHESESYLPMLKAGKKLTIVCPHGLDTCLSLQEDNASTTFRAIICKSEHSRAGKHAANRTKQNAPLNKWRKAPAAHSEQSKQQTLKLRTAPDRLKMCCVLHFASADEAPRDTRSFHSAVQRKKLAAKASLFLGPSSESSRNLPTEQLGEQAK